MTLRLRRDAETTGRLLHEQILAEARREIFVWDQDPMPLRDPIPDAPPITEPMAALTPTETSGKPWSAVVVRLHPRGLTLALTGLATTLAHLTDGLSDTAVGLLT